MDGRTNQKVLNQDQPGTKNLEIENNDNLGLKKRKLSLNKPLTVFDPRDANRSRNPFETLSSNTSVSNLLNRDVKFLKTVKKLNPYNKILLESFEEDKCKMSSKKSKAKRLKKKENTDGFNQKSLLSYFDVRKSICDRSNATIDAVDTSLVISDSTIEANIINSSFKRKEAQIKEFIDLCESSDDELNKTWKESSIKTRVTQTKELISSQISNTTLQSQKSASIYEINKSTSIKSSHSRDFKIFSELKSKQMLAECRKSTDKPNNVFKSRKSLTVRKTRKYKELPSYKVVKGTPFAVDAFCYGDIPGVEAYFLTHFHSDHYMGLNKSFSRPLYCSKITAELCQQKLRVASSHINILETNCTLDICGIKVTAVDANHCPGSVMFIIQLPSGRNILHCGDFRASSLMESYPEFWNNEIHTVYLDTTYCDPRYVFPTQSESINEAVTILKKKKAIMESKNRSFEKLLVVCGTYTIGKEKFFMGVAAELGLDVWAPADKNAVLKIALNKDFHSKSARDCQLHVLSLGKLTYQFLDSYLKSMEGKFEEVVAFKPTGWELSKNSLIQRGNVTIHGIPYSEHSSFSELQRFVKFLQPKNIIPTVIAHGGNKAFQKHFACWVGETEQKLQKRVSDYFNFA